MNLYCYLVESKDKTFDMESLKAFKSLKAYRYFADGFIQNVCIHPVDGTDYLYVKCLCYPSQRLNHTQSTSASTKPLVKFIQPNVHVLLGKCQFCVWMHVFSL